MLLPVLGLFLLFGNLNVHAEESANLEKELNELIEKGYISEEVTLQDYEIAKEEEAEQRKQLINKYLCSRGAGAE